MEMNKKKMWWEVPGHLEEKNNQLCIADEKCIYLAEEYGTPLYVINAARIKDNYKRLFDAVQKNLNRELKIFYAAKANTSLVLLKLLNELGSCLDTVSPYEVFAGETAGFFKERKLYTGTSVSYKDMISIAGKTRMNIDSISQLERYAYLIREYNFDPRVSIRINPEEGAGHVAECMTAGKDAKYGIPKSEALKAFKMAIELNLKPIGIHQHIGSGILEPDIHIFYETTKNILDLAGKIRNKFGINFEFIDFGGGVGIPYKPEDKAVDIDIFGRKLGEIVEAKAKEHKLGNFDLFLEPGRYIVGDAGILLMEAVDVTDKYIPELGVDAGFNVFDRAARYKTYHEIVNAGKITGSVKKEYRISGNLCESGDVFNESKHHLRSLPVTKEGDIIAVLNAGAYGCVMASNYNMRPRAREIMIENKKIRIIREIENFADLIKKQIF
jgi:diaminopimelate decarboxylase